MLETATLLVVHATGLKRPRKEDIQVRWAHPRHKNQKGALLMEAFLSVHLLSRAYRWQGQCSSRQQLNQYRLPT